MIMHDLSKFLNQICSLELKWVNYDVGYVIRLGMDVW